MTAARRSWVATFSDEAVLSDLREALRAMAGELDDCDPDRCLHPEQRVHPHEVYEWLEREVLMSHQRPMRFERGHRPRRQKADQLTLAIAG